MPPKEGSRRPTLEQVRGDDCSRVLHFMRSAWAQVEAREPFRDRSKDRERQDGLQKWPRYGSGPEGASVGKHATIYFVRELSEQFKRFKRMWTQLRARAASVGRSIANQALLLAL